MFPKKRYKTIKDLRKLDIKTLHILHEKFAKWKIKNETIIISLLGIQTEKEKQEKIKNDRKTMTPPLDFFNKFLSILAPPFNQCCAKLLEPLDIIAGIQDIISPSETNGLIIEEFVNKFGEIFIRRGHNFSRNFIENSWNYYDNFDQIRFDKIVTKCQIINAIKNSPNSLSVNINIALTNIRDRIDKNYGKSLITVNLIEAKEKLWDDERIEKCAKTLIEASEYLKLHLIVTEYEVCTFSTALPPSLRPPLPPTPFLPSLSSPSLLPMHLPSSSSSFSLHPLSILLPTSFPTLASPTSSFSSSLPITSRSSFSSHRVMERLPSDSRIGSRSTPLRSSVSTVSTGELLPH